MRSDVGKIVQKKILHVKIKMPQRREREVYGSVFKKGENAQLYYYRDELYY